MKSLTRFLTNVPLLSAIASLFWVADGVLRRGIGPDMPILSIIFYEYLVGFLIVLPLTFGSFLTEKPTFKELAVLGILSILSGPLAVGLFTYALFHSAALSFTSVYIIQKLQSVFAITAIGIVAKRKLHKLFPLYAIVALLAAFLVIGNESIISWQWDTATLLPAMAALGAAAAWGISALFSFAAIKENTHQFVTASRFLLGAASAFIALLLFGHQPMQAALTIPSMQDGLLILLLGASTAAVSLVIYFRALRDTTPLLNTFLELLYPLFAFVLGIIAYQQIPNTIEILGMIAIVVISIRINRLHDFTDLNEI